VTVGPTRAGSWAHHNGTSRRPISVAAGRATSVISSTASFPGVLVQIWFRPVDSGMPEAEGKRVALRTRRKVQMSTPTIPKKDATGRAPARLRKKNGQFRARRKTEQPRAEPSTGDAHGASAGARRTRSLSGGSEHLIILVAALVFGVLGLAVHFLWFVSIVLMALTLGLLGAEIRRHRGHGLVAEVVAQAKGLADEIGAAEAPADEAGRTSAPEESSEGSAAGS
jgi:hypothetical protein